MLTDCSPADLLHELDFLGLNPGAPYANMIRPSPLGAQFTAEGHVPFSMMSSGSEHMPQNYGSMPDHGSVSAPEQPPGTFQTGRNNPNSMPSPFPPIAHTPFTIHGSMPFGSSQIDPSASQPKDGMGFFDLTLPDPNQAPK